MATILLSVAGAAIGSSMGGSLLGLSMTAVGRFIGASLGHAIDQRIMGQGSDAVEVGKIDRFRVTGAGEGAPIAQVYGRMRLGGHVIWATHFEEHVKKTGGGGKGAPPQPKTKTFSYSVSLALALCEGEIASVQRVWADGVEVPLKDLNMRVYRGTHDQLPDPKIEAVEGTGLVPAYRGTAYVVMEDLQLGEFGNRIPQFSFEVVRPELEDAGDVPNAVTGVAMIPGTGEYALATEPVYMNYTAGSTNQFGISKAGKKVVNVNSPSEDPDFNTSLKQLREEMPGCTSASLVVSWFGSDLRCGSCEIKPKVEDQEFEAPKMPWSVSGLTRDEAEMVPTSMERPVYGGTPTDTSVVQAIRKMADEGVEVMYYPFILMEQMTNSLPDPWTGAAGQPKLPWRGRITLSVAPGRDGSPDGTAVADAEVAAFIGTVTAADFAVGNGTVTYTGPAEWSYSRFILHQAALCAAAGGVNAFCIGSEMVGLTQIRGAAGFPAVQALKALAAECRTLLGPSVKLGYAADWTEYFGYHPQDGSGDLYFHLDPLWSDDEIDFVGIDNYMPLSDWRDEEDHADAAWQSIYNLDYLKANIAGGEGYDWFYDSQEGRDFQRREPITDGAYDEPWVWRYKDIRNWWSHDHYERIGGVRAEDPTEWEPQSKPIWFTELGCASVDKGTNQPNKFVDPKSSESSLPYYSNGMRDELIQRQYIRAMYDYWGDAAHNPVSEVYGESMIDMGKAFVWAWDARPYPWFPGNADLWSDGPNYRRGHWLNGRASGRTLASVVREICERSGLTEIDTSQLHGYVRGYVVPRVSDARHALQPLMIAYGFDAIERDGLLVFRMRTGANPVDLDPAAFALSEDVEGDLMETRAGEVEMVGRVRVGFVEADGDHAVSTEETVLPDERTHAVAETDLNMTLTRAEGRQTAERWLAEARVARDSMRFALPPSKLALGAGDIVRLPSKSGPVLARIDRVEVTDRQIIDAVRIVPDVFKPAVFDDEGAQMRTVKGVAPVTPVFMDLPLIRGDEVPHAPHLAIVADPWPGSVAVYDSAFDADYLLNEIIATRSTVGVTEVPLFAGPVGRMDTGAPLRITLPHGTLQSISDEALLAGGNLMAIGDGTPDRWELLQFREADLVGPKTWELRNRLRGQLGSDALMPQTWPAGSLVVMMDGLPTQIALAAAQRRMQRHFRIGPARRPYDDPSYVHEIHAFEGNGLRPYSPVHLTASGSATGQTLRWIRRTRIEGDSWDLADVPLGEDLEAYVVRVEQGGTVLREAQVAVPEWTYTSAMQSADGASGLATLSVAQVSARFGPGPFASTVVML
ncbi:baseplate multidomain protein megatron [Tropicibacter sp. S64]|uniref:baseplate multidomain protein megatron n=1 Tax=Tropicibacter sp. S64 TaxID=3415122 RepID=UPI003C7D141A